jgi:hypothetical protein
MAEMYVRSRRIDAQLDPQRPSLGELIGERSLGQNVNGVGRQTHCLFLRVRHRPNARLATGVAASVIALLRGSVGAVCKPDRTSRAAGFRAGAS